MLCTSHHISFGWSNQEKLDGLGIWQVWGTGEVHKGFWRGNLRERDHLQDLRVDSGIILKVIFKKLDGGTD